MQTSSPDIIPTAPSPPRNFTGRKRQITKIIQEITAPSSSARIALLGMGGIGKSAMARQIAEQVSLNFPGGIFWGDELPAKDDPGVLLRRWGRLCGQNLEKEQGQDLVVAVRGLLHARKVQAGPILVMVDDARLDWAGNGIKSIDEALPPGTPLLITTRQARMTQEIGAKVYPLNVLSRSESCQLLLSLSGNNMTKAQAREIAELCGDMPLALELMGRLTQGNKRDLYLERLRKEAGRLDVLKLDRASRKEQSVRLTLDLSYQALAEQHPETARLFRMLGAFAKPTFVVFKHLVDALTSPGSPQPSGQASEGSVTPLGARTYRSKDQARAHRYENEVFVSYAPGGESEAIVGKLEQAFASRGIRILRDKKDVGYKDSIKEFQERLGRGQCVVLVISDAYLRSNHCMYELLQVQEYQDLRERIFPVVLGDARIYDPIGRLAYIKYWEEKTYELDQAIKQVGVMAHLRGITEELDTYARIRAHLAHLTDLLRNMNALSPSVHEQSGFSALMDQVERTLSAPMPEKYVKSIEDNFLRLVDWSLLLEDEEIKSSQVGYFQMHTLLHEYTQSILVDRKEIEDAIDIHIRYSVSFANANAQLDLQKQQRSTLEFEKSYAQLQQALTQIKEHTLSKVRDWNAEPELCYQIIALVAALDHHWKNHSQFAEQVEWLGVAYTCADALGDAIRQADFARRLGRVLGWQGNLDEGLAWMRKGEEGLEKVMSEEANATRALLYIHRASIHFQRRAFDKVEDDCRRGLNLVDAEKHPRIYAEGSNLLGVVLGITGKPMLAIEAFEKSLSIWKQVEDRDQVFRTEDNLRTAYFLLGDMANARRAEEESLAYWEQYPDRIELAMALTNRGLIHYRDEEHEAAIRLHRRALEMSDLLGVQRMRAMIRVNLAWPFIALRQYDKADAILEESLEIQSKYDTREYWIEAHRALAEVKLGIGHGNDAMDLAQKALKQARKTEEELEEGACLRLLGQVCHAKKDHEQAKQYLESGLSLLRENELKYEVYLTLLALIRLYRDTGQAEEEQCAAQEAQKLIKEMGLAIQPASSQSM